MNFLKLLNDLSIRKKLIFAFGIILILTGLVGLQANRGMSESEERNKKSKGMHEIVNGLFKIRNMEKDYLITKDEKFVLKLEKELGISQGLVEQARLLFSSDFSQLQMDKIENALKSYEITFLEYVDIENKKKKAMSEMRKANNIALVKASEIDVDQKSQLTEIRQKGELFLADKLYKVEAANSLLKMLYQARALRIQLVHKKNTETLNRWKQKNNEIFENTRELKSKFILKNNIDQANKILQIYKVYEDGMLSYLQTKSSADYKVMIDAAIEAETEILAIVKDQKRQLEIARVDNDKKIKDKIRKASGATIIIQNFLDARKNEKEVIISGSEVYLAAVRNSIDEVLRESTKLKESFIFKKNIDQIDQVIKAVKNYRIDFEKFVTLLKDQKNAKNNLDLSAIEAERTVEKTLIDQEEKKVEERNFSNAIVVSVTVVAISLGLLLALLISDNISKPLVFAAKVANKLAKGDTKIKFDILSDDESGQLLNSMKDMIRQLDSSKESSEVRDWVKTAQTQLADVMREESNIDELLVNALSFYEHKLNLQVAALFLKNEDKEVLEIAAHTGVQLKDRSLFTVREGEGIVGQCAAHKKEMVLSGDDEYDLKWEVNLGIASINLKHIFCIPLVFDREVVGVFVFGKIKPFLEKELELSKNTSEAVAIAITSAHNQDQMKSLLTELKTQSKELKKSKKVAEEADHAKSEFLANMSHEIRTPMNAIIGMSNLVKNTKLDDKQFDYITKIEHSAQNLLGIINDILDYSKIEAGKMAIEHIDFNMFEMLNDIVPVISQKASDKKIELLIKVDPNIPENLYGDPLRISQILINLMNNAIKFTEQGEVILKVESKNENDNKYDLRFEITDTGIGMTIEQQSRLFQSFSQADSSTTRKYGGSGLGLKISKEFVTMMGGEISVNSEVGKGSHFEFTLQLEKAKQMNESHIKHVGNSIADKRILVVEDHDICAEILKDILESFSCEVKVANNGEDGIKILKESHEENLPFDFVLMDWKLPGIDGIEATKLIKSDNQISVTPTVIMVSAFGEEEVMKKAEEVGAESFLHKPVTASTLLDTILQFVDNDNVLRLQDFNKTNIKVNGVEKLKDKKVLVVEDNLINQEIAFAFLKEIDVNVDIANNGKEAVEMVFGNNYDLVLMDVQMPVMDGYEATKEIRNNTKFSKLPILAMTASAMLSDREEALEVGMNDHIAKPIDVNHLYRSLLSWLDDKRDVEITSSPKLIAEDDSTNESDKEFKLEGVNTKVALKNMAGNKDMLMRMLSRFADKYKEGFKDVDASIESKDEEYLRRYFHSLRGVSLSIGAIEIGDESSLIELEKDFFCIENIDRIEKVKGRVEQLVQLINSLPVNQSFVA